MLIVADGAPGLTKAVGQCSPASDRQHCARCLDTAGALGNEQRVHRPLDAAVAAWASAIAPFANGFERVLDRLLRRDGRRALGLEPLEHDARPYAPALEPVNHGAGRAGFGVADNSAGLFEIADGALDLQIQRNPTPGTATPPFLGKKGLAKK